MKRLRHTLPLPKNVSSGLERRTIANDQLIGMWLWPLGPLESDSIMGVEVSSILSPPGVLWLVVGSDKYGGQHLVDHRPIPDTSALGPGVPQGKHVAAIQWLSSMLDAFSPVYLGAQPATNRDKSVDYFGVGFFGRYSAPEDAWIKGEIGSYYLYFAVGDGKFAKIVSSKDGMIITATIGDESLDRSQGLVWQPLGHCKRDNISNAWRMPGEL